MAVDGGGRLERVKKILVWTTRFGVSFHFLPESRPPGGWGTPANAFRDFNFFRRLLFASSTFTATTRTFPLPRNTSGRLHPLHLPSCSRPVNRADMFIGDAYGAAHVVDREDPHRVLAVLRRPGSARRGRVLPRDR